MSYVIGIENDHVVINRGVEGHETVINSREDYFRYFEAEAARLGCEVREVGPVYHSSSMDFPREYTTNPDTLALVAWCKE